MRLSFILCLLLLSACNPALKDAQKSFQAGQFNTAAQKLKEHLQEHPDDLEALSLKAQIAFHTQGPAAASAILGPLATQHQHPAIIKAQADILQKLKQWDQLAQTGSQSELENYISAPANLYLKERTQWLLYRKLQRQQPILAKQLLTTLQEQTEDPTIQQLVAWESLPPQQWEQLLAQYPESSLRPLWYWGLIQAADQQKQVRRKDQLLLKMKQENKDEALNAQLLLTQAESLLTRNPTQSWAYYRTFLEKYPEDIRGREALYTVRAKLTPRLSPQDYRFLTQVAADRYMYQSAWSALSQAGPLSPSERYQLGVYALKANLTDPAQTVFKQLAQQSKGRREGGLAQVRLAEMARKRRAYSEALSTLQQVKSAYGSQSEVMAAALWEEGQTYDMQNRNQERAQVFRQLVETRPDDSQAMSALWFSLWESYLQKDYQNVINSVDHFRSQITGNALESRFLYWQARCYEHMNNPKMAQELFTGLSQGPLTDYYTYRAQERLKVLKKEGEDHFAMRPFRDYQPKAVVSRSYAAAWEQRLKDPKKPPISAAHELFYLGEDTPLLKLAAHSEDSELRLMRAQLMHQNKQYYAAITQYRSAAQKDSTYLPAAYPLGYFEHIVKEAPKHQLNPFLVSGLIWQESQYKPDIRSWVGATGLMQIMPATGVNIAQKLGLTEYNLTDAPTNIRMGTWYLAHTHETFNGNSLFAVASYNAGAGPALRWQKQFAGLPMDAMAESITYPETRDYVKKVFTGYWIYERLYSK